MLGSSSGASREEEDEDKSLPLTIISPTYNYGAPLLQGSCHLCQRHPPNQPSLCPDPCHLAVGEVVQPQVRDAPGHNHAQCCLLQYLERVMMHTLVPGHERHDGEYCRPIFLTTTALDEVVVIATRCRRCDDQFACQRRPSYVGRQRACAASLHRQGG